MRARAKSLNNIGSNQSCRKLFCAMRATIAAWLGEKFKLCRRRRPAPKNLFFGRIFAHSTVL